MFIQNKHFNRTICWILILALFLQSLPITAQAFDWKSFLADFFSGIKPPDQLKLEDDGDIMLGSWRLAKCIDRADINNDGYEECVNPFSTINFGQDKTELIDEQGRPDIPRPDILDICELRIPLPEEDELLTREERRALMEACSNLRRIQRSASYQTYFAKKIFNATDPLSDCLFLRNCKTQCYLRYGSITYKISVFDVAELFLPMGWVNFMRKIYAVYQQFREIQKIFVQFKNTIVSAVTFVNDLFEQIAYLSTFFSSLKNVLSVVEQGRFAEIFDHYSNNLEKFAQAKSEAQKLIADEQKEVLFVADSLKKEEWAEFLYSEESEQGDQLQEIINNYLLNFQTTEQIISHLINNADFLADSELVQTGQGWKTCPENQLITGIYVDNKGIISKIQCSDFFGRHDLAAGPRRLQDIDIIPEQWNYCDPNLYMAALQKDSGKINKMTCAEIIESPGDGIWQTQPNPPASWDTGLNECRDGKYIAAVYRNNKTDNIKCRDASADPFKISCADQESPACHISKYTAPANCEPPYISGQKAHIKCPAIDCAVSAEQDGSRGEIDKTYTFNCSGSDCSFNCADQGEDSYTRIADYCPEFYNNCYVECGPEDESDFYCSLGGQSCDADWDPQQKQGQISCSSIVCAMPFDRQFGTYSVSCEQAPVQVEISCPADCSFECIYPENRWFGYFKNILSKLVEMKPIFAAYSECLKGGIEEERCRKARPLGPITDPDKALSKGAPELLDVIKELKNNLLTSAGQLILNPAWPDKGSQYKYWSTSSQSVSANELDDALYQAQSVCEGDAGLFHYDWDRKIEAVQNAPINSIKNQLDKVLAILETSPGPQTALNVFNGLFWQAPVIIFQIEEIEEQIKGKGTGAEQRIVSLKEKIQKINQAWASQNQEPLKSSYIQKIIDTKDLSQNIKTLLEEIIPLVEESITWSKKQFLAGFLNNVGVYVCPGTGFLGQLKCFEDQRRPFEQILVLAQSVEKLEDIFVKLSQTSQKIKEIKPSLEIPATKLSADFNITIDDSWNVKTEGGLDFNNQGVDSFDEFMDKVDNNVLSYLDQVLWGKTKEPIDNMSPGINDESPGIDDFLREIARALGQLLYMAEPENCSFCDFLQKNKQEIEKIKGQKNVFLRTGVFGDEALRQSCNSLNLILKNNPEDFEKNCPKTYSDYQNAAAKTSRELCGKQDIVMYAVGPTDKTFSDFCQMADYKTWWKENFCSYNWRDCGNDNECIKSYVGEKEWAECVKLIGEDITKCFDKAVDKLEKDCSQFINNLSRDEFEKICSQETKNDCGKLAELASLKQECDDFDELKQKIENGRIVWPAGEDISDLMTNPDKLKTIRTVCNAQLTDILTPLTEIMDVYSFLLGWKSGTQFYSGIKTSKQDAQRAYQNAQKMIAMIKDLPERLKQASKVKGPESGLDIEALRCIEMPAQGWHGQTGVQGGPVCPRIDYLFSIIESNFAIIRQNVHQIDMLNRKPEWVGIDVGTLKMSLWQSYEPKITTESGAPNPIYHIILQEAEEIRNRSRNLWALATALNFANQNCACGQSFCKFPLCVSGIPLTLAPLKDPYCYLVYILRHPMLKQAKVLENYLK